MLHLFIPCFLLLGLVVGAGGTFALINFDLRLGATLYATRGGAGKTSWSFGSLETIDLQCLLAMEVMEGSLGSYWTTNTGLACFSFSTFFRASCLGIVLAFSIALSTTPALYPLDTKSCLSSPSLLSLVSLFLQMRTILRAREKGIFFVTWAGWQEDVRRYWFLSVGFL